MKSAQHCDHPRLICPKQYDLLQKQVCHKIGSTAVRRILKFLLFMLNLLLSLVSIMLNWLFFITLIIHFTLHLDKDNTSVL